MKKIAQAITICVIALFSSSNIFAISTFIKYPQNPLFHNGNPSSVIKDNNQYKMWYTVNYGQGWRINYAYSPDGISNWIIPNQTVIPNGTTDGFEMDTAEPYVIFNSSLNIYQMWYTSIGTNWTGGPDRFRLRYATSNDSVNWTVTDSWVMKGTPGSWDAGGVARGHSIIFKDGLYKMWYAGTDEGFNWKIGYANSSDGINWTKGNGGLPILTATGPWELNTPIQ